MELQAAKELVFEHANSAFSGVFSGVLSVGQDIPDGYGWEILEQYEKKKIDQGYDSFESQMFCDQAVRVVDMIEHYVSTYGVEHHDSSFHLACLYIKNLCLNLSTELKIYDDSGFHDLCIERDSINRICSKNILEHKDYISEVLWEESFSSDEPPFFADREKIKSYLSERRFYTYPFNNKVNGSISKEIRLCGEIEKEKNTHKQKRTLNTVNVAVAIAKYTIGNKSVASYHPNYSSNKYITPFLFNGLTIAMENTKKPQIWVRYSDLRSLPRSVKYQPYEATTKMSMPYGRHSGLKAIKELAWDKVIKFKLSSMDDLQVVLSHLITNDYSD